jgi:DICT domain-containing protein
MPAEPAPAVRGVDLDDDDPLVGEWTVAVVGAHYAAALIGRDMGDGGPDLDRRFEFTVTHDPRLVLTAARSLLRRVGSPG